ncbi:MAG: hypothetical protein LBN92_05290, partial [Treponema sp.]|nr:hypothetical protein [Treponema sp.]
MIAFYIRHLFRFRPIRRRTGIRHLRALFCIRRGGKTHAFYIVTHSSNMPEFYITRGGNTIAFYTDLRCVRDVIYR